MGHREGIFGFVMSGFGSRQRNWSAGRFVALALGVSAPVIFWAASTFKPSQGVWHDLTRPLSAVNAAERQPAAGPDTSTAPERAATAADQGGKAPALGARRPLSEVPNDGSPEGRLLEVYRLIGEGKMREALARAQKLTQDIPNFQLAQLTYGDLLLAQTMPLQTVGNAPTTLSDKASERIAQLRTEALRRIAALQERPPVGAIPKAFVELPPSTRHALAVDASRSRIYLFENRGNGMQLVDDHYASIGKLGAEKNVQGDQRTPIGVYYITSRLEPTQLTDFYGAGALPLNYPNEHDKRLGRTGSGIWLHGVPSDSYARSPQSTDGCVAMANPELRAIMDRVQPRTTPVVIAKQLEWVEPQAMDGERRSLRNLIEGWRVARSSGDMNRLLNFYSPKFASGAKDLSQWRQQLSQEAGSGRARNLQIKDLAILAWHDRSDLMVVTFGELADNQATGVIKRQYWTKEDGLWKIFFEGVIG
jgi:murein L,D-transpeptidase YafK